MFKYPLILDGAMGTMLMKAGMPTGVCPEEWILSADENINKTVDIQKQYIEAGSDAIYAPTFGANKGALAKYSLESKASLINGALAEISVNAREQSKKDVFIGGDISPTGCFMQPYGDKTFDDIFAIYKEQAQTLNDYVDFFVIETQISLAEARAAVLAVKSISDKPIFVTVTVENENKTLSGDDIVACMLCVYSLGAKAFGLNCSRGPKEMSKAFSTLMKFKPKDLELIAKPNAGMPKEECGHQVFDLTAEEFADEMLVLYRMGVRILGGCCGTTPEYIKALKEKINKDDSFFAAFDSFDDMNTSVFSEYLVCTNKTVFYIKDTDSITKRFKCDEFLYENIENAEEKVISIELNKYDDFMYLNDALMFVDKPVMFYSEDFELLEKALKEYVGRPIVSKESKLSNEQIISIKKNYSPIFL